MATRKRRVRGEGSIFKRSDGQWVARFEGQVRYAKSSLEAKDRLNAMKAEKKNGVEQPIEYTISQLVDRYLSMKSLSLKPASYDRLESTCECQIKRRIGNMPANLVTEEVFKQSVLDPMKSSDLAYSSIKKAFDSFNACMRYAKLKNWVDHNPLDGYDAPSKEAYSGVSENIDADGSIFALTETQRSLFRKAAYCTYSTGNYRFSNRAAYILCLYTGLRMGELLGLRWKSVDLDKKMIRICEEMSYVKDRNPDSKTFGRTILTLSPYTKTGKPRTLKLNDTAFSAIKELKDLADEKKSHFVVSTKDGEMVKPKSFQNSFTSMCDIAGIELPFGSNVHVLRHTFASMLFAKGVNVKVVSALLGHSSVQITMNTYIHLIQAQEADAMEIIDIN